MSTENILRRPKKILALFQERKSPLRTITGAVGIVTAGQICSYALSFVRNMILARILTKSDFGIAAALATAVTLFEFVSKMALDRQIIQDPEGDSPQFQETSHTFQFLSGGFGALLILVLSLPLASIFHIPHIWWAFALLAFIPLFKGLENLDIYRFQRNLKYWPAAAVEVISQFVTTLISYPVAVYLMDFRAFIVIVLTRTFLNSFLSHIFAKRPFRLRWDKNIGQRIFGFAWPLLVNGFLLFASQQADKMLVGTTFTLGDLGLYSISFSLVSIPWYICTQISTSVFLPLLSKVQKDRLEFNKRYRLCLEAMGLAVFLTILPLILAGEQAVYIIYGDKYHGGGVLMALLGIACSLRFLRNVPVLGAMARADTKLVLYTNISRVSGLVFAFFVVWQHYPLWAIAASAIIGEVIALLIAFGLLHYRHALRFSCNITVIFWVAVWLLMASGFAIYINRQLPIFHAFLWTCLVSCLAIASSYLVFPGIKKLVYSYGG